MRGKINRRVHLVSILVFYIIMVNKNHIMKFLLGLIVFVVCLVGCKNGKSSESSFQIGKDSIAIIYTKVYGNIYRPMWENSRNFEVEGKIMNFSQATIYKDFVVEVDYKSKTGTLLETRKYTLYTTIEPQKVIDFSKYIDDTAPPSASFDNTTWRLLSVTASKE